MNLFINTASFMLIIMALVERSFIKYMQTNAQKTRRVLVKFVLILCSLHPITDCLKYPLRVLYHTVYIYDRENLI